MEAPQKGICATMSENPYAAPQSQPEKAGRITSWPFHVKALLFSAVVSLCSLVFLVIALFIALSARGGPSGTVVIILIPLGPNLLALIVIVQRAVREIRRLRVLDEKPTDGSQFQRESLRR